MICPELINLPIPSYNVDHIEGPSWSDIKKSSKIKEGINLIRFARTLTVVIPADEQLLIEKIKNDLESGSYSLYMVEKISLAEMVRPEFVEAFVKRGKLHGISSRTRLETDDCASILPDGTLLLNLTKDTYQCVKFCGGSNHRKRNKYVVKIDLKSAIAKEQLERETLTFDMIFRWIPGEVPANLMHDSRQAVSVRSLEHYLSDIRSLKVLKLPPTGNKILRFMDLSIPLLEGKNDQKGQNLQQVFCSTNQLIEYIGMLALDCNTQSQEFVSSYSIGGCTKKVDSTWLLHQKGLFTPNEVEQLVNRLAEFIAEQRLEPTEDAVPWVSLHVQGFPNVPLISAGMNGCGIDYNYDSAYTIVIGGKGNVFWKRLYGCNGSGPIDKPPLF